MLEGLPGRLNEHRAATPVAARETHQQVLRRQPPRWRLPSRLKLLLDRFEEIFPHERFMGSNPFVAARPYTSSALSSRYATQFLGRSVSSYSLGREFLNRSVRWPGRRAIVLMKDRR